MIFLVFAVLLQEGLVVEGEGECHVSPDFSSTTLYSNYYVFALFIVFFNCESKDESDVARYFLAVYRLIL